MIRRKEAALSMEGQFLVWQIYEDELTYNIVGAAAKILSKSGSQCLKLWNMYTTF